MINLPSWERKYIDTLADKDLIAWGDFEAWQRYPKHSWIYDLHALSSFTNVPTFDLEREVPDSSMYPYIIKPRSSFKRESSISYVVSSEDEIEHWTGMVAQRFIKGHHGVSDIALLNGVIVGSLSFTAHSNFYGNVSLYESNPFLPLPVANTIRQLFKDYTGVVSVDFSESSITGIRLRPSVQFFDISNGFISQLPTLVKNKNWNKVPYKKTYCKVYRTMHGGTPVVHNIPDKPSHIESVQLCWEQGEKLLGSNLSTSNNIYMKVNGFDLQSIIDFGNKCKIELKR